MTDGCANEPLVRRAATEDRWTDALRQHVASCEECAAAVAVSGFMTQLSRASARPRALPDPAVLWLKAHLMRGSETIHRATRPLNVVQMLAYVVLGGGWAALLTWRWPEVLSWALSVTPSGLLQSFAGSPSTSATVILAVVILGSMTLLVGLHSILSEE
ncbi:MAG TPA: hypothetical protein VF057_07910 [Thermoanaerobaculia bacterium]